MAPKGFHDRALGRIPRIAELYLGGKGLTAPLVCPVHADLHGLPLLLLQVGTIETLLDDTQVLAERVKDVGVYVDVEFSRYDPIRAY